ncbi:hypothetical protein STA3757_18430 [Stanieria sp. NIES-3757]|nr:hypothetical protein STA3757_18430 [Stanieria sp. NIES-3757]
MVQNPQKLYKRESLLVGQVSLVGLIAKSFHLISFSTKERYILEYFNLLQFFSCIN